MPVILRREFSARGVVLAGPAIVVMPGIHANPPVEPDLLPVAVITLLLRLRVDRMVGRRRCIDHAAAPVTPFPPRDLDGGGSRKCLVGPVGKGWRMGVGSHRAARQSEEYAGAR